MHRSIIILLIISLISITAHADVPFKVDAKAAVLIDAATGRILYAQNADEMLPMASTTKIMTALIALQHSSLSDVVTAPAEACGIPGTSIYLTEGEHLTLEQLLYGLMLRSGNDAATAIAIHIAGSRDAFVKLMNDKADEMGVDAHFSNPHGLDSENHHASALALALIMREALQNEDFARITSTEKKIIPWEGNEYSRVLYNKNKLLASYEGATGGKTGYTSKAGRCLVFSAERNGVKLIGCVLNCSTWFDTAEKLLDYGFENYTPVTLYKKGNIIEKILVIGGQEEYVELRCSSDITFSLGLNENYTVNLQIKKAVAPVEAGAAAGVLNVLIDGDIIYSTDVIYNDSVAANTFIGAIKRIYSLWTAQF